MDVNELYDAWKGAEGKAREDLQVRLYAAVKTYAGRLMFTRKGENPYGLADEIAAEVMLGLERFRGAAKFSTWASRIAFNMWNDYIKDKTEERDRYAEARHIPLEDAEDGWGGEAEFGEMCDPRAVADFEHRLEAQLRLEEIEGRISEKDMPLYQQVFREGKSHREAAESMGKSQHAVESAVRRFRSGLKRH